MKSITTFIVFFFIASIGSAQLSQNIIGIVQDKITEISLPGATVEILDSSPIKGTSTDINGRFKLEGIDLGRASIKISFIGYEDIILKNINLTSGKEMNLVIEMEEKTVNINDIEVLASASKERPNNKMATVSARSFSVEETEKYAGSRGDVARMAMNFAGVSGANDSRNDIVIRGNSPSGLLWKLNGIDIGNPNHFAQNGTTGGPVGMLNNNMLRNSDFFTGAFPSEYGNALSGVFDLKLKTGNKEKYEFLGQIGFNGFEVGIEGPISKKKLSSFIVNYRYSTLGLMDKIGGDFGTGGGIPYYQDLSYNVDIPLKNGTLNIFGLAGTSNISILDSESEGSNLYTIEGQDLYNGSDMVLSAVSYGHRIGNNTYLKHSLSFLHENGWTEIDTIANDNALSRFFDTDVISQKVSYKSTINHKLNSKISFRSGITIDKMGYDLKSRVWDNELDNYRTLFSNELNFSEGPTFTSVFNQWQIKFNEKLKITPGIHINYFSLSDEINIEPRLGIKYQINSLTSFNIGYGIHSRVQSLDTYYVETILENGEKAYTNKELSMSKAQHIVLGIDRLTGENSRLKAEIYYQNLYNIPVERNASSYSILNSGSSYGVNNTDSLVNNGQGINYGVELTMERFYKRGFYYLATMSLFDSKYKGSDNIERNTAFNVNYVFNVLAGKEFEFNNKSVFFVDLKGTISGGRPYTPINIDESILQSGINSTVFYEERAFSERFDQYMKFDVKIGYRLNGKRIMQEWIFYVENITNHNNVLMQTWDNKDSEIKNINQLGLFPMMQYRILF